MKVFISWSGELSRRVAELLKEWIPNVLQSAEPWISSADIEKGAIWFDSISDILAQVSIGLLCLTRENVTAPWILFEAGALSKGLTKSRVCTFLIEADPSDLKPPLSQFNATKPGKEDLLKLIQTINASFKEKAISEQRVQASFDRWWPEFEEKFNAAKKNLPSTTKAKRTPEDMTVEILETVRAIQNWTQRPTNVGTLMQEYAPYPFRQAVKNMGESREREFVNDVSNMLKPIGVRLFSVQFDDGGKAIVTISCEPDPKVKDRISLFGKLNGYELSYKVNESGIEEKSSPDNS